MSTPADVVLVGAAIIDVPAGPVDESVLRRGTAPAGRIVLGFGGDALNEATVLCRLGRSARLVSCLGADPAGRLVLDHCREEGIDTEFVRVDPNLDTGVNIVLVAPDGERSFLTNPKGSLRALRPADVPDEALEKARILSFASIFVSPHFGPDELAALFARARQKGLVVCADTTLRKGGESVRELSGALRHTDYLFTNHSEGKIFTGEEHPGDIAAALLAAGAGAAVVKLGSDGCWLQTAGGPGALIPACPVARCLDTTGAGDTFAGAFLCGLLEGRDAADCARFACAAASLAVEAFGATAGLRDYAGAARRYAACYATTDHEP